MPTHRAPTQLALLATLLACSSVHDEREPAHPMASFERMVSGEWQMRRDESSPDVTQFDVWSWGPGKHSVRVQTDGSGGDGGPWRELQVLYWHPGREQVCLLGLVPHGWGVAEGTIRFDDESGDATFDLYQHGNRRALSVRWAFDGADRMRETLVEDGLTTLAEWSWFRSEPASSKSPHPLPSTPELTESLQALAPLLGHTWRVDGEWATGERLEFRSTLEWVPYATAVEARASTTTDGDESIPLLDLYFYDHTGRTQLRCLALTAWGGVYEGDVTVLEDGALELDLKGYEGERVAPLAARFDLHDDGSARGRVWSLEGSERTVLFDARLEK